MSSVYGPRFAFNPRDATFWFYIHGSYGFWFWEHLRQISYPFLFIDVGANQGLYSIGAASNSFNRLVYAFEPVRDTFNLLCQNISRNNIYGVSPQQVAISVSTGYGKIAKTAGHSGAAKMVTDENQVVDYHREQISCVCANELSTIVTDRQLPIVLKVDVEGHEAVVLAEIFKSAFSAQVREAFVEVNETRLDSLRLLRFMSQHGFEAAKKIGDGNQYDVLFVRTRS